MDSINDVGGGDGYCHLPFKIKESFVLRIVLTLLKCAQQQHHHQQQVKGTTIIVVVIGSGIVVERLVG